MKLAFKLFIILITMSSCASLGTKTIYEIPEYREKIKKSKIIIFSPELIGFKNNEINLTTNNYFKVLTEFCNSKNISYSIFKDTYIEFDSINFDNDLIYNDVDAKYMLVGQVQPIVVLGQRGDIKVNYKIYEITNKKLVIHTRFNTAFGKTYFLFIPTYDKIVKDAIKSGLHNIDNIYFKD